MYGFLPAQYLLHLTHWVCDEFVYSLQNLASMQVFFFDLEKEVTVKEKCFDWNVNAWKSKVIYYLNKFF